MSLSRSDEASPSPVETLPAAAASKASLGAYFLMERRDVMAPDTTSVVDDAGPRLSAFKGLGGLLGFSVMPTSMVHSKI